MESVFMNQRNAGAATKWNTHQGGTETRSKARELAADERRKNADWIRGEWQDQLGGIICVHLRESAASGFFQEGKIVGDSNPKARRT
jgi:hypothetical protein